MIGGSLGRGHNRLKQALHRIENRNGGDYDALVLLDSYNIVLKELEEAKDVLKDVLEERGLKHILDENERLKGVITSLRMSLDWDTEGESRYTALME